MGRWINKWKGLINQWHRNLTKGYKYCGINISNSNSMNTFKNSWLASHLISEWYFQIKNLFSNRINYWKYWKSARSFCSAEGRAVGLGQVCLQGGGSTKVTGLVALLVATPLAGETRLASRAAAIPLMLVGTALSSVTLYDRKLAGTMGKKKTRWKWREVLEEEEENVWWKKFQTAQWYTAKWSTSWSGRGSQRTMHAAEENLECPGLIAFTEESTQDK